MKEDMVLLLFNRKDPDICNKTQHCFMKPQMICLSNVLVSTPVYLAIMIKVLSDSTCF